METIEIDRRKELMELKKDLLFGYDFSPEVTRNQFPDPKATYSFKRWDKDIKCETKYRCTIKGADVYGFVPTTKEMCGKLKVFFIALKRPTVTQNVKG